MDLTNPIIKVIKTADGSNTLYHQQYNEIYHSRHGAYQESMHVFIEAGLKHVKTAFNAEKTMHILEVGFGTGLNCILSFIHKTKALNYTGLDTLPIPWSTIQQLQYDVLPDVKNYASLYQQIMEHAWDKKLSLENKGCLTKIAASVFDIDFKNSFHLIYFDAFAPNTQPLMWEIPLFEKLFIALKEGGCLVTYCAKGQVRRNMIQAGFQVERIPGPAGKREMLRALKSCE